MAVVPIDPVCRYYFAPLTLSNLMCKVSGSDIALSLVRMEAAYSKRDLIIETIWLHLKY
jgi:hypothetical protein